MLFYFPHRSIVEQQAAEDITMEVFLKLWQRINDLINVNAFHSFLYTTTKNASLNYLRDSRCHKERFVLYEIIIMENKQSRDKYFSPYPQF